MWPQQLYGQHLHISVVTVYHSPLSFNRGFWPPCLANLLWTCSGLQGEEVRMHISKAKQSIRVALWTNQKKSISTSPTSELRYKLLHNLFNVATWQMCSVLTATFDCYSPTLFSSSSTLSINFSIIVTGYFQPASFPPSAVTIYNSSVTAAGKLEPGALNRRSYAVITNINIYHKRECINR